MLVNNADDLQNIQNNLSATTNASSTILGYAIGKDIDATAFSGYAPGATLNTVLDGSGGLGANYTISNLNLSSSGSPVALFPFVEERRDRPQSQPEPTSTSPASEAPQFSA